MASSRQTTPIRRPNRKAGEEQGRKSQPGRYRRAWHKDVTNPPRGVGLPAYGNLDEVPSDLRERAAQKSFLVRRFVEEGCPRGKLLEYARAAATALGVPMPPHTTLRDWAKRYQHWGVLGLVDKVRSDAGRSRTVTQNVREIALVCVVGARYGTAQALNLLQRLLPGNRLPNYHALRREIERFKRGNPHLMAIVAEGLTGWRNRFRLALPGVEFPAAFRYAVDSTVCDVWVRVRDRLAPTGWKATRCVLTVVEDVGSRALLTFNLSVARVDSGIALGTFRRAVMPGLNYPGLPTVSMPIEVLVDAGPEHLGLFRQSLTDNGVDIIYTSGSPEQNGRVERVIETITTEVFSNLPAYDPSERPLDPYKPPKADDRKNLRSLNYELERRDVPLELLLTIEQLEAHIHAWATIYNGRPHVGLKANTHLLSEAIQLDRIVQGEEEAA